MKRATRETTPAVRTPALCPRRAAWPIGVAALAAGVLLAGPGAVRQADAVPQTISVSGSLRTVGGGAVADGDYILSFQVFDVPDGGQALWQEGPAVVTVASGRFAWTLGGATPLGPLALAAVGPLWLEVQVGNDPPLPRAPFASVLTALRASLADQLACSGCVTTDHLAAAVLAPYAKQATLAAVATTGSFYDLVDAPLLSAVALTGQYADLEGLPALSDLALAATETQCPAGQVVTGVGFGGALECTSVADGNGDIAPTSLKVPSGTKPPSVCDAAHAGHIYLNSTLGAFYGCTGTTWAPMSSLTLPMSCAEHLAMDPALQSGTFDIDPDGTGPLGPSEVACDMDSLGGGWTMLVRLNTNDGTSRVYGDTAFWDSPVAVGSLSGDLDWIAAAANGLGFTEIRLVYDYAGPASIAAVYKNAGNTKSLRENLNLPSQNTNPVWARTSASSALAEAFFGPELRFQTVGNDPGGQGTDYSRIWFNLTAVSACNQGGSIGHIGDAGTNNWTWEVARGSDLDASGCQHNTFKLGLGANYDPKSWGGTPIEPQALYSDGVMRIYVR